MYNFADITPTNFFQHAVAFSVQNKDSFCYWFESMLYQACGDLFDQQGDVKPILMRADKINSLLHAGDREIIKKRLLRDYCETLLNENVMKQEDSLIFREFWHLQFDALLQNSIPIAEYMQRRADREWSRVCELWRWVKYCVEYIIEKPLRFCQAIQYLGYAIFHYLSIQNNAYFNIDMLAEINEELARTLGQINLNKNQALMLVKLQNAFDNQQNPSTRAPEIKSLFAKNENISELCALQFTLLSQFFLFNVSIDEDYAADPAALRQNDTTSIVMQFLSHDHFYYYFNQEKPDHLIPRIKKQLKLIKSIYSSEMTPEDRIEFMLPLRQMLLYWSVSNKDCLRPLIPKIAKATEWLHKLDITLNNTALLQIFVTRINAVTPNLPAEGLGG